VPAHGQTSIALDFDGVLCDSARETAISAWRAGRAFWPDWQAPAPPRPYVERFLRVRPWLETGYQAVVMMRMIADGLADADFAERLPEHCQDWLQRLGLRREDLVRRFGQARDEWIRDDFPSWLASHAFYPGVIDAVRRALERAAVFVLTTKQERFARALLESQAVFLPGERLWGLDRSRAKVADLLELAAGQGEGSVHFVEDRAETLRQVLAEPALAGVHLYYASWGYGTAADLAWAERHPRVRVWGLDDFLKLE
jgi:phosphoglycolate phosphatase-like HAD superfamily hydrolase